MHLAIRVLKWVVGLAVFVATADFLGGVDLLSLVTGSGWLPAVLLSLFFSLGITPMYGIYNTRVLNAQTAPRSLRELATDPRWRGRVVISRPTRGGTGRGDT